MNFITLFNTMSQEKKEVEETLNERKDEKEGINIFLM